MHRALTSRSLLLGLLIASATMFAVAAPTAAFPALQAAFFKQYLTADTDPEFVKFVKTKAKCNVCHQGKNRKNRNAFGQELSELVDMKKDARNADKLKEALVTVAAMHSVKADASSPTYGDLIAEGKLPAGDLDASMTEPEKAAE